MQTVSQDSTSMQYDKFWSQADMTKRQEPVQMNLEFEHETKSHSIEPCMRRNGRIINVSSLVHPQEAPTVIETEIPNPIKLLNVTVNDKQEQDQPTVKITVEQLIKEAYKHQLFASLFGCKQSKHTLNCAKNIGSVHK